LTPGGIRAHDLWIFVRVDLLPRRHRGRAAQSFVGIFSLRFENYRNLLEAVKNLLGNHGWRKGHESMAATTNVLEVPIKESCYMYTIHVTLEFIFRPYAYR
jgi:hypothetical protein